MEKFCQGTIVVQERKTIRKKGGGGGGKKKSKNKTNESQESEVNLDDVWLRILPQLNVVLAGEEIDLPEHEIPLPFDATLEKSIDDQK